MLRLEIIISHPSKIDVRFFTEPVYYTSVAEVLEETGTDWQECNKLPIDINREPGAAAQILVEKMMRAAVWDIGLSAEEATSCCMNFQWTVRLNVIRKSHFIIGNY